MDQLVMRGDILQENIPIVNAYQDRTWGTGEVVDSTELVEASLLLEGVAHFGEKQTEGKEVRNAASCIDNLLRPMARSSRLRLC